MNVNLLTRREKKFVLWRPKNTSNPPKLVIGQFQPGNPPTLIHEQGFNLSASADFPDLWEIAASACQLSDGEIYHYWFEIDDSDDEKSQKKPIRIADPAAFTVDWRLVAARPDSPSYTPDDQRPASVIRFKSGKLVPCDPASDIADPVGEEFADQHDRLDSSGYVSEAGGKQVDPVNYSRAADDWRKEILQHVTRLVKLRTLSEALASDDVEFIHIDFNDNKRVLVWRRGAASSQQPVVVVANFSDFTSENAGTPQGEYLVHNWPATPSGKQWKEITQDRLVQPEWVGREPIFAWEAKVYTPV